MTDAVFVISMSAIRTTGVVTVPVPVTTNGTPTSGWTGDGSTGSPRRLEFSGENEAAVVPGTVAELQDYVPVTADMWFRTGPGGSTDRWEYLLDWSDYDGEGGMSVALYKGQIRVKLNPWVDVAPIVPATWYHLVVAKQATEVRVYLNGARVHTGREPNLGPQTTPIGIGTATGWSLDGQPAYGDGLHGAVAQITISRGAMTDAQALASFNADKALYLGHPTPSTAPAADAPTRLALVGFHPNPARSGNLMLAFSLPTSQAAVVEMIDVSGRRVVSQEVGSMGAGNHVVQIGRGVNLPAGIYMIRLAQGGQVLQAKVAVVR